MSNDYIYIVYDVFTKKVVEVFEFDGKGLANCLKDGAGDYAVLNRTHPEDNLKLQELDFSEIY